MRISSCYQIGNIKLPRGEKVASVTAYQDYLVVITDKGTVLKLDLADW